MDKVTQLLPMLRMLTVRQVIDAGDAMIDAAGLNPWCMNEGLAEGHEPAVGQWQIDAAIEATHQAEEQIKLLREALEAIAGDPYQHGQRIQRMKKIAAQALEATNG